jgi:hypothetical protein
MNREAILSRLQASEGELRARGDNRPDSDVDILIEMHPEARVGMFQYVEIVNAIEDMFPLRVDVSNSQAQKTHVRSTAQRDAIYAF